jgi:hypothetical protein
MRKICEIDGVEVYQKARYIVRQPTCITRIGTEWLEAAFTPAQLKFLEKRHAVLRPHPKHNPKLELFIDETDLDRRDWTVLHLLF